MRALAVWLAAAAVAAAQPARNADVPRAAPNASVGQTVGVTAFEVHYGRPAAWGQDPFGEAVPWGEVWQPGAHEPTTLTASHAFTIEADTLEAGTYGVWLVPHEAAPWEWRFTTTTDRFDSTAVIARAHAPAQPNDARDELLTFGFTDVTESSALLVLRWGPRRVSVMVEPMTAMAFLMQARMAQAMSGDGAQMLRFARYALDNDLYLKEAQQWAAAAVSLAPTFEALDVQARLAARIGRWAEADRAAARALDAEGGTQEARAALARDRARWDAGRR